jgi:hypothetical protein
MEQRTRRSQIHQNGLDFARTNVESVGFSIGAGLAHVDNARADYAGYALEAIRIRQGASSRTRHRRRLRALPVERSDYRQVLSGRGGRAADKTHRRRSCTGRLGRLGSGRLNGVVKFFYAANGSRARPMEATTWLSMTRRAWRSSSTAGG